MKTRTLMLAMVLLATTLGQASADPAKVVVIPMAADSETKTGVEITCPAAGFFPESQDNYYGLYQRAGPASTYTDFACPLMLPVGSTITKLTAYIRDNDNTGKYGFCWIRRTNFSTLLEDTIAQTPTTIGASTSPQVRVDETINTPVILSGYGYYIECKIYANTVTIVGVTVTYDE